MKKNELTRLTGTAIPLGALYTKESPVIGEYTSLKLFADFAKKAGLKIIQLLPVNDTGTQSSPYSGLSAFALHPIYVCLKELPEFSGCYGSSKKFKKAYDEFEKNFTYTGRYNYQEILNSKVELLRVLYETTSIAKDKTPDLELNAWITENPWIVSYAVYKRLKWENLSASWKSWAKEDQLPGEKEIQKRWDTVKFKKEHLFYAWMQMRLCQQFSDACEYVKKQGIILKGDMPIMMNEDSCDAWAYPQFFNHNLRAGSPVDGENPSGQNWGFPTYNWANLKKEKYAWWKNRLTVAQKFYGAYRLDHILGFFRIWAIPERDTTAIMGHADPYAAIERAELNEIGFDDLRLRWLSQPHIKTSDIDYFTWSQEKSHEVLNMIAEKLDGEELWLFKDCVKGDRDLYELELPQWCSKETGDAIRQKLAEYWNNRTLIEIEKDKFIPLWTFEKTFAWSTLNEEEQTSLKKIIEEKNELQDKVWSEQATDILKNLTKTVSMQACGEDLGVGLACVPAVMKEHNILGLNVVRWTRYWDKEDQPYVDFADYRPLSITTTSVHDSTTVRQWWADESKAALDFVKDNEEAFAEIADCSTEEGIEKLKTFTPEIAQAVLNAAASSASTWCIHPLQDFMYMDESLWLEDAKDERVNVPGCVNEFNWTWRMPCLVEELIKNKKLTDKIQDVCKKHES
ncbi:MAG: 4-alpha-glucanotransferase [Treponema sp.]|nr:4-alpha-glucanotransferase [Treponema sp.]